MASGHDHTQTVSTFQNQPGHHPPGGNVVILVAATARIVEELPHERGIEVSHETVRFWWGRTVVCRGNP